MRGHPFLPACSIKGGRSFYDVYNGIVGLFSAIQFIKILLNIKLYAIIHGIQSVNARRREAGSEIEETFRQYRFNDVADHGMRSRACGFMGTEAPGTGMRFS